MWSQDSGGHCSAVNFRRQNPEQVMLQLQRIPRSPGRDGIAAATTGPSLQLPLPCHHRLNQSHGVSCAGKDAQGSSSPTPDPAIPPVPQCAVQRLLEPRSLEHQPGILSAAHHQSGLWGGGEGSSSTKERGREG